MPTAKLPLLLLASALVAVAVTLALLGIDSYRRHLPFPRSFASMSSVTQAERMAAGSAAVGASSKSSSSHSQAPPSYFHELASRVSGRFDPSLADPLSNPHHLLFSHGRHFDLRRTRGIDGRTSLSKLSSSPSHSNQLFTKRDSIWTKVQTRFSTMTSEAFTNLGKKLGWGDPGPGAIQGRISLKQYAKELNQRQHREQQHEQQILARVAQSDESVPHPSSSSSSTDSSTKEATVTDVAKDESDELLLSYLVHFAPGVTLNSRLHEEFKQKTGIELGSYFPHRSYMVMATPEQASMIESKMNNEDEDVVVDWIGEVPNESKVVSPALVALMEMSGSELKDAAEWTDGLRLNIQLQPLPRLRQATDKDQQSQPQKRSVEELKDLASTLHSFVLEHFPALDGSKLNIFGVEGSSNNLLRLKYTEPLPAAQVKRIVDVLTQVVEVRVVELWQSFQLYNEAAQALIQSGTTSSSSSDARPIWSHGLRGSGQMVGSADSGLDWDHCMFDGSSASAPPPNFVATGRKVVTYVPLADGLDDVNGHGTHVAGSIVGHAPASFTGAIGEQSGMAPEARIFFQDIGDTSTGALSGLDGVELGEGLFQPAYEAGARIHSDSWGSTDNSYSISARELDEWIWNGGGTNQKKMLILVAAGNDGLKQGSVQATVGSPATAKNMIAVGASQTTNAGWIDALSYVPWQAKEREAAYQLGISPSNFDCCSSNNDRVLQYCCETYVRDQVQSNTKMYSAMNMAAFSSRGPTIDGRVKPELVAPGQLIISARSDGQHNGNNQCSSPQQALMALAGTSMATPIAAGGAILVRQYLTQGYYPSGRASSNSKFMDPSAMLLAAVIINGAQSLTGEIDVHNDGREYAELSNGIFPLSVFQGFGRMTLDRSLWFEGETRYGQWMEDMRTPIESGQDEDYCVKSTGTGQMKATLVWHDAPGVVGAGIIAVNNLDVYMGRTSDDAVAGNFVQHRDTINNIEQALFDVPKAGETIYVKIRGIQVPTPTQYYALVISGPMAQDSVGVGAAQCGGQTLQIAADRFPEATREDHFPYGPVVGGTVGGLVFLGLLVWLGRFCWRTLRNKVVI